MQQDISILSKQKQKKLGTSKQKQVIELFNNLFSSGFHLAETVDFLGRSALLEKNYVQQMRHGLANGQAFSEIMASLGFSDAVVTQLSLAELHGNLSLALLKIEEYLDNLAKVKKKLIEVATYPMMLLGFLVLIMMGLRNYLLPQLSSQNLMLLGLTGAIYLIFKGQKRIPVYSFLARLPFVGSFVKIYLTAYYAREWGNMIGQGLELSQIFQIMQEQLSVLFQEIGQDLGQALQNGQEFSDKIASYPFLKKELSLIIEYGEVKSKLGSELEIYALKTWEEFFGRVNRTMNLIQPLVFVFVALMIVLLYAAMLLPLYQNMEVHL